MPTELQSIVNELADLLQRAKERPCPDWFPAPNSHVVTCIHKEHGYSGAITDPNLQAAWELLVRHTTDGVVIYEGRFVGDWPDGAVRGLLEQAGGKLGADAAFRDRMRGHCVWFWVELDKEWQLRWFGLDVPSLGKAIKEALKPCRK